jgi:hypothetical protein
MTLTMKKSGKEREAKFNWTDNKDAKTLAEEYRKIGQQFVWVFDIGLARENQPLDAPSDNSDYWNGKEGNWAYIQTESGSRGWVFSPLLNY